MVGKIGGERQVSYLTVGASSAAVMFLFGVRRDEGIERSFHKTGGGTNRSELENPL